MLRRLPSIVPGLLGALIVLVALAGYGRPAVFTDTDEYFIHGYRIAQSVKWAVIGEDKNRPETPQEWKDFHDTQWEIHFGHSNMGARSPYYGMMLYGLQKIGSMWLLAGFQALCVAWLVFLIWRGMAPGAPIWSYFGLMAVLSATSSLPLVAGFAVPDIFAAVGALSAIVVLVYRDELKRWELGGALGLLVLAMIVHNSHIGTGVLLLGAGAAVLWLFKAERRTIVRNSLLVGAAIVVAVGMVKGYALGIKLTTGDNFGRPPFLAARVLADGPGRDYLRHSCGKGDHWVFCRFKDTPLNDSEVILWSDKAEDGVFNVATLDERVAMDTQEMSFVLHAIAYEPVRQIGASMANWGLQLVRFWVDEPLRDPMVYLVHPYWKGTNLPHLILGAGPCTPRDGCKSWVDWQWLAWPHGLFLAISAALIAWRVTRRDVMAQLKTHIPGWDEGLGRDLAASSLMIVAILLNAAVCGMLSGPFARYEARIVWLLPATAGLMLIAMAPAWLWDRLRLPEAWVERARAVAGRLDPTFARFFIVGGTGFLVDYAILQVLVGVFGVDKFAARFVSFPIAVLITWTLNRNWTFGASGRSKVREGLLYFAVQGAGGVANIGVYSLTLLLLPMLKHALILPVGFGSAAGLCLTFLGSKHIAFRKAPEAEAAIAPAVDIAPPAVAAKVVPAFSEALALEEETPAAPV